MVTRATHLLPDFLLAAFFEFRMTSFRCLRSIVRKKKEGSSPSFQTAVEQILIDHKNRNANARMHYVIQVVLTIRVVDVAVVIVRPI